MKMRLTVLALAAFALACASSAQQIAPMRITIRQMFDLAEKGSTSMKTYRRALQEAEQAVKIAKDARLPYLDVSVSASYLGDGWIADRDFSSGTNINMPHFGNNFALEASQVLYSGGAISGKIAMAKLQQQIASLDVQKNRQDIRFLLVGNYLELYKIRNQRTVYLKNIDQTQKLIAEIKAKQSQGVALRNDITRYELQKKSLELAVTQLNNSGIIINDELVTVMGLDNSASIEIDTTIIDALPASSPETSWQHTALMELPEIKQAELGISISKQAEIIARSERLPSVALFAADKLDGPITIEVPTINSNFNYCYVGVGVKYSISSIFKSGKNIKKARLATERAREIRELLDENVKMAVKAAHVRYCEAFTVYDTRMKSFELAMQNYKVVNNRYLNDLALITDMLDASNQKLEAELQVANARINILYAYYKLKKACGNL